MHEGALSPGEIRTWVANRYYYQTRIPIKDGLILAKAQDPAFRRAWISRIHDHDGTRPGEGGLALWLALAEAVGLERARVESLRDVLPGVRRACDAYVELVELERPARVGGVVAHRAVRGRHHGGAHRRLREALSVGARPRGSRTSARAP